MIVIDETTELRIKIMAILLKLIISTIISSLLTFSRQKNMNFDRKLEKEPCPSFHEEFINSF